MRPQRPRHHRRATVLVLIIGLLTMLFMMLASFLTLARSERQAVVQIQQGARTEEIVNNLTDVMASIGLANEQGRSYTRIPGFGDAAWLASNSPFRDASFQLADEDDYRYLSATSLSGTLRPRMSIRELSFEDPNAQSGAPAQEWRRRIAQSASMDADGDGVPDASFLGSGLATQIANSIGGRSISANIVPAPGESSWRDPNNPFWRLFDENARYEVAVRIISHGGMVQIAAPTATERWNTSFLLAMFDHLRDPRDNAEALNVNDLELLNALYAQRSEVEAFLRYRGGILNPRTGLSDANGTALSGRAAVDQLAERIHGYGDPSFTLFPSYADEGSRDSYQRFNLADPGQWDLWRRTVSLDASDTSADLAKRLYAERRDLTTVNNSDELVRIQSATTTDGTPRLVPGSVKFYLGRVAGAFDVNGLFTVSGSSLVGDLLAGAFGEMLANYDGWRATPTFVTHTLPTLVRSEQARMLAANTMAFAAPRTGDPNVGITVDVPWVIDRRPNGAFRVFFGAGPQPYITQALVYKAEHPYDPNMVANAAAIEFFNPHDVRLDPSQFGISIVNPAAPDAEVISRLDPNSTAPMSGVDPSLAFGAREFSLLLADKGSNSWFRDPARTYDGVAGPAMPRLQADVPTGGTNLSVRLWRLAASRPSEIPATPPYAYGAGMWVMIDELEVTQPDDKPDTWGSDPNDPNSSGPWPGSYADSWRDTRTEAYWAPDASGRSPRWRVVMPVQESDVERNEQPDQARLDDLKDAGPAYTAANQVPTTPLYSMNPALGSTLTPAIHGAVRPSAFPTVGFMHFIGRFAHTYNTIDFTASPWEPANKWLERAWRYEGMALRADLAFMPVFSNRQLAFAQSEFSKPPTGLGRVPWGLLVYDYFTTLNTRDPNGDGDPNDAIDPMRVDGRININTAPWRVLAALPLIGPNSSLSTYPYDLPLNRTTSPSFWSYAANMLNGAGPGGPRLLQIDPNTPIVRPDPNSGGLYRLGEPLAQAIASYRDGVNYVSASDPNFYGRAAARNIKPDGSGPEYRPVIYGDNDPNDRRAAIRDPSLPGFTTLGELLNVKGFDATVPSLTPQYTLETGDYIRAVSLLALLDTHFLTTRSNTYTMYATLFDREHPESSIRTQVTFDRSDLVPRIFNPNPTGGIIPGLATPLPVASTPEIISERRGGYFATGVDN